MANPMTLDDGHFIELAIATVGGLAAVGMVVLKFAMRGLEQQHTATRQLIEERFQWAEQQRQDARQHWEEHFTDLRKNDERLSQRITQMETRVAAIEIHMNKNKD